MNITKVKCRYSSKFNEEISQSQNFQLYTQSMLVGFRDEKLAVT